jgi:hypothetical protein
VSTKRKWIVWSIITVLGVGLVYVVWCVASAPGVFRDCYAQWDTAELIIRFHRQYHKPPASWEDIQGVYGDGSGLRGGLSVTQLQQRITIEFERLGDLEALARSTSSVSSLPEVVQTRSGLQSHWAGAEPNKLIYDYFRESVKKR